MQEEKNEASMHTQDATQAFHKRTMQVSRSIIYAIAWVLTWVTSGGLTTGFGPVYSRLVEEKQWHELCTNTTEVCSDQEVQLQSVYSTGILMTVLGQTVFGALLDTIGPRYMTLVAYLFSIAGNVCMAFGDSKDGTDGLLIAGFALIGFGGMGVLYASLQLSTLFREPALYTSLLVAAYSFSGYIYTFLGLNITRQSFFLAYTILVVIAMLIVYLVFPVHHITGESERVVLPGLSFQRPHTDISKFKFLWAGLKKQLKRRDLWACVALGSFCYLSVVFAGGAVPSIVTSLVNGDLDLKNKYTNYLYPLLSNSAFLFSPIAGYLLLNYGIKRAAYVAVAIFSLLCISFMLPYLGMLNVSYLLIAAANGFLTCLQYVYVMHCFPHELYGILSGFVTMLVFLYCLLSFALTSLAQYSFDGKNSYVFMILLATTFLAAFLVRFLREESECSVPELQISFIEDIEEPNRDDCLITA